MSQTKEDNAQKALQTFREWLAHVSSDAVYPRGGDAVYDAEGSAYRNALEKLDEIVASTNK